MVIFCIDVTCRYELARPPPAKRAKKSKIPRGRTTRIHDDLSDQIVTVKPVSEELPEEPVPTGEESLVMACGDGKSVVIEDVSRVNSEVVATIDMDSPEVFKALAEQGITVRK